jgi:hypothetical protein
MKDVVLLAVSVYLLKQDLVRGIAWEGKLGYSASCRKSPSIR